MRKLLSLFLALLTALAAMPAAFAGEPYTLDIWWVGNGDNPEIRAEVEDAVNEYIEPIIGAHVRFHIIPWDDWKKDVIDVLVDPETGKAVRKAKMDLVFTADWEYYPDLVEANALFPLDDLLEQHGQGILSTLPEGFFRGIRINGKIYGVPTNKELCVPQGFIVNRTRAAEIGWDYEKETITCTADLEPWLEKYREKYPDSYPYLMDMAPAGRWVDEPWINDWSGLSQNALAMRMAENEDGEFDETVYSIFETPEEEAHIRLMHDWVQKGYISPENARMDKGGAEAVFETGDFLVFTQALKGSNIKAVEMYTEKHKAEDEPFEVGEIVMQPKYIVTAHTAGSMFAIPVTENCDPDKAMEYLNLMHSDAVLVNLMLFGAEGRHYTKAGDRKVSLTETPWYTVHGGAWTVGDVTLQYVLENEDPEKNEKLIAYAKDAEETCCLGFRFDRRKLHEESEAVNAAVGKYADGLLCGTVDPDDPELGIEAFRAALKEAGIDRLREKAQEQFEAWKNAQK